MEKREAEAAASQGVSNWVASVFDIVNIPINHRSLFPSQLTVEESVKREQALAEAAQNVFKGRE